MTMAYTALLVGMFLASRWVYRRVRLRRALFMLRRQIAWSLREAPRDLLVLDVGGGNNPHLRADVVCEKYIDDDLHRGGGVAMDLPLVAGDASALPFKTGSFDVVISRALIEHLEDPRRFFEEAGRVARGGLFVAPSEVWEHVMSLTTHLWTIKRVDDALHFSAKARPIINPLVHGFLTRRVFDSASKMDDFILDHWDMLRIDYTWSGQPKCVVHGDPPAGDAAGDAGFEQASTIDPAVAVALAPLERWRAVVKAVVRRGIHRVLSSHRRVEWSRILACPRCLGDVTVSTDHVACASCRLRYPYQRGIPIMLLDHAKVMA